MSLIQVTNLTFAYDGSYDTIFDRVSFQLDTAWKLGFIGRNGRGKTTFLNLLLGKYPYSGTISSAVLFDYFPFVVTDKTKDTLQVIEEVCPQFAYWQLQKEMQKLKLEEDVLYRPFATLSNGEQTKMLLAGLFLKTEHFLLIDEPTNHLDAEGRQIVSDYLKSKSGFILVSHDRNFLDNCVDHILSINKTNIEVQKGNFSSWYQNKERQDAFELHQNEKLEKEIKQLSKSARQAKGWGDEIESRKIGKKSQMYEKNISTRSYIGEKSRRMQQRRKNLERRQQGMIAEKTDLLQDIEYQAKLKLSPLDYYKETLALLEDVSIYYGDKQACGHVSFAMKRGQRILLRGKNGSGKSSIIKLIQGQQMAYTGRFERGSNLKISYVSQDTTFLTGDLSDFAREHHIEESLFKTILRKLDFSRIQFEKDMKDFSQGQKKKVLLAKSLCEPAHLYLWDEPLNYIDVLSRMQIEELLLGSGCTMLFVEHDKLFSEKIATDIVQL